MTTLIFYALIVVNAQHNARLGIWTSREACVAASDKAYVESKNTATTYCEPFTVEIDHTQRPVTVTVRAL